MTRTTRALPQLMVDQTFDAETGSRVIVSLTTPAGRIVLDISPRDDGTAIDVEAYPYDTGRLRMTHQVWSQGKFGPLWPGQVVTYGMRPLTADEKAEL